MALTWWQHHKHCLGIIIIIIDYYYVGFFRRSFPWLKLGSGVPVTLWPGYESWSQKTRVPGLVMVKCAWSYTIISFESMPACDGRTNTTTMPMSRSCVVQRDKNVKEVEDMYLWRRFFIFFLVTVFRSLTWPSCSNVDDRLRLSLAKHINMHINKTK